MSTSPSSLLQFGSVGVSGIVFIFSIVGLATPMLVLSTDSFGSQTTVSIGLWSLKLKISVSVFGITRTDTSTMSASDLKGYPCGASSRMFAGQAFGIIMLLGCIAMGGFFMMRILPRFVQSAPNLEAFTPMAKFGGIALASGGVLWSLIVFALFSGLRDCTNELIKNSSYSYGAGWVMYLLCFLMCVGLVAGEAVILFVLKEAASAPPELPTAQPMLSIPQQGIPVGAVLQPMPQPVYQPQMQQQAYHPPMQQVYSPTHQAAIEKEADDL